MYDSIVVGGGHAGVEAALALAKMNKKVMLVTGDLNKVASLPCNPSIGGPAKGIVVREIDALGGAMAKATDLGQIQMKLLNASKGPAVRALRAQVDKVKYPRIMLEILKAEKRLELLEAFVDTLWIENKKIKGIILEGGEKIASQTVIITTGTYLASKVLIGHTKVSSGPNGEKTTYGISGQLKSEGFEVVRLKTGTPPRIAKDSIDYSKMTLQPGDDKFQTFSFNTPITDMGHQEPCYLTHTSPLTHQIINENLAESSMYGGIVEGIGPRYCPSIEDKIVRFEDKERHQIFIEPESLEIDEMYLQGLSTSMPKEIQEKMVRSVPGLENAVIVKHAYAIEYDAINPIQLYPSLETKIIENLFCAGQINGTSGYEEAAGQGLMAGINAGLKIEGKEPLILKRNEAYIGVLIDDLVTKGTQEPYRLLTSRAEYRLLLRHDNADLRLREYGYQLGLIDEATYQEFVAKKEDINRILEMCDQVRITPTEENINYLNAIGSAPIYEGVLLSTLLKRPEIDKETIKHFLKEDVSEAVYEQVETQIKYDGYIKKSYKDAEKMIKLETKVIPQELNYHSIKNLSSEGREKLIKIKPQTLGQASRILGVNPADISILMVYLESQYVSR